MNLIPLKPPKIYPKFLPLERSNKVDTQCDYLDLNITITDKGAKYTVYDKRRIFGFPIIKFPHYQSCIHESTLGGTIQGECNRYASVCTYYRDFKKEARVLCDEFMSRGWSFSVFFKYFSKFCHKKYHYEVHPSSMCNDLVAWRFGFSKYRTMKFYFGYDHHCRSHKKAWRHLR